MKQYDAIIIGFGKGGKTLTAELAKGCSESNPPRRSDRTSGKEDFH